MTVFLSALGSIGIRLIIILLCLSLIILKLKLKSINLEDVLTWSSKQNNGFLSDEGPMLETLYYTIRIGSTPTFLYFDLYIYIYSSLVLTGKHIHFKVAPYGSLKIERKIIYVGLKNCLWIFRKRIQLKLCIE